MTTETTTWQDGDIATCRRPCNRPIMLWPDGVWKHQDSRTECTDGFDPRNPDGVWYASPEPTSSACHDTEWDVWADIATLTAWLDANNGRTDEELTLRILKLSEEVGEVAQAVIGMRGQNPRKGVTHTETDLAGELCDVVVTAMVALNTLTGSPVISKAHLAAKVTGLLARAKETS